MEDSLIDFDVTYNLSLYKNEYEKEVLEHDKDAIYKIFKIEGNAWIVTNN